MVEKSLCAGSPATVTRPCGLGKKGNQKNGTDFGKHLNLAKPPTRIYESLLIAETGLE
jgi:hypothetical protein